jgi:hypothetical protein
MQLVKVLPSKIAQIDGPNALCEDGSVWTYVETGRQWAEVHPPHEPPTQSTDLAEALAVLRRLWNGTEPSSKKTEEAYEDAYDFLKKHGA